MERQQLEKYARTALHPNICRITVDDEYQYIGTLSGMHVWRVWGTKHLFTAPEGE